MKKSAGVVLFRMKGSKPEFLLVHPGGPFWSKRDLGAWSIPKGELLPGESPLDAARREFKEETGFGVAGEFIPLEPVLEREGKLVYAWAVQGDLDPTQIKSNLFELEWPPNSAKKYLFPEIDRGSWFGAPEARLKIVAGLLPLLDQAMDKINAFPD
jgi:predicted NUDIX family NTP pyrophosphohydrolase